MEDDDSDPVTPTLQSMMRSALSSTPRSRKLTDKNFGEEEASQVKSAPHVVDFSKVKPSLFKMSLGSRTDSCSGSTSVAEGNLENDEANGFSTPKTIAEEDQDKEGDFFQLYEEALEQADNDEDVKGDGHTDDVAAKAWFTSATESDLGHIQIPIPISRKVISPTVPKFFMDEGILDEVFSYPHMEYSPKDLQSSTDTTPTSPKRIDKNMQRFQSSKDLDTHGFQQLNGNKDENSINPRFSYHLFEAFSKHRGALKKRQNETFIKMRERFAEIPQMMVASDEFSKQDGIFLAHVAQYALDKARAFVKDEMLKTQTLEEILLDKLAMDINKKCDEYYNIYVEESISKRNFMDANYKEKIDHLRKANKVRLKAYLLKQESVFRQAWKIAFKEHEDDLKKLVVYYTKEIDRINESHAKAVKELEDHIKMGNHHISDLEDKIKEATIFKEKYLASELHIRELLRALDRDKKELITKIDIQVEMCRKITKEKENEIAQRMSSDVKNRKAMETLQKRMIESHQKFTKRIKELENIGKERTLQVGRLMTQCRYLVTLLQKTGVDTAHVQAEMATIGRIVEGTSLHHQPYSQHVEHIFLVNEAAPKPEDPLPQGQLQGQVQPPTSLALSYLPSINTADSIDSMAVTDQKHTPRIPKSSSVSSNMFSSPVMATLPVLPPSTPRTSALPPEYPPFNRLSQPLQTEEITKRVSRPATPMSPTSASPQTFAPTPPAHLLKSTSAPKFTVTQMAPVIPRPRTPTQRPKQN